MKMCSTSHSENYLSGCNTFYNSAVFVHSEAVNSRFDNCILHKIDIFKLTPEKTKTKGKEYYYSNN